MLRTDIEEPMETIEYDLKLTKIIIGFTFNRNFSIFHLC